MAWIESHVEIGEHPKVFDLITSLSVQKAEAVGLLHLLWHFTMKFAWRDGDLSKFNRVAISRACGWESDPDMFIDALIKCGFLDNGNSLKVHDWHVFAGKMVKDRLRYKKANRIKTKSTENRQKSAEKRANLTLPNLTLPNQIKKQASPPVNNSKPVDNFSQEIIDKAKKANDLGFNVYQQIAIYNKGKSNKVPEIVINEILDEFFDKCDSMKDIFPYMTVVVREKSRRFWASLNEAEGNKYKKESGSVGNILKQLASV